MTDERLEQILKQALTPEIDDSEDLEKHMKLLNGNKIARRENVFCYTWSELKIYNKKLGELK